MAKRKRKDETPAAATKSASEPAATTTAPSIEPPPVAASSDPVAVTEAPAVQEQPEAEPRRGQFRSWVVDTERGYTRLTDVDNLCIVLQFNEKPGADVLAAVKDAGFQFRTNHHGRTNCWVRANNFVGRQHVENIEKLIGVAVEGRASAVG